MKKFICIILTMLLFGCSSACAEEGVFVPYFNVFMDRFSQQVKEIDPVVYEYMMEDFWEDNAWVIPEYSFSFSSRKPVLDFDEGNGFLDRAQITINKDYFDENEEVFKELILAAATSICNANPETFFDDIYFDYVVDSPAGYISMYYNCDVYRFVLTKSSSEIELEISLSVYIPD